MIETATAHLPVDIRGAQCESRGLSDSLVFPTTAIVGSVGDLACELALGTEVPDAFYFASGLTVLGAICSPDLTLDVGLDVDTRLYTVLLGDSYAAKKSTAMKKVIAFLSTLETSRMPHINFGIGSAEGLAVELSKRPKLLVAYDELRAFVDKTRIQSSVLLPMATSLFEQNNWDNRTKDSIISVRNARLSFLGCCTTSTYGNMWTTEAISIGFPNRLFVVNADAREKVAWPRSPNEQVLCLIKSRLLQQIGRLPLRFGIAPDAKEAWETWYSDLPSTEHVRRLDTIGLRLLPLIALITDKDAVDLATVQTVIEILNYELSIRMLTDPIDADGIIAKLEEKIRRSLKVKGPQSGRDLRRAVHADRDGLWAFNQAVSNLFSAVDIVSRDGTYALAEEKTPHLSPTSDTR
jgi:hypothetical protein